MSLSQHDRIAQVLERDPELLAEAERGTGQIVSTPSANCEHSERRESAATLLTKLARRDAQLFYSDESCFATVTFSDHQETYNLHSRGFRRWLTKTFFDEEERAAGREAVETAITTLEGFARFQSDERAVFVRVADHCGRIYLDLCNERWQVAEISGDGWRVIGSRDCPVRFRRAGGMLALPSPERGEDIDLLREFLNLRSDADFALIVGWVIGALHPRGPYPVLILHGEQGAAKSTTARVLRGLIDPNTAPQRSEPRETRDLMIAAKNGWVCSFDNISSLPPWFSDAFCRLSTGSGFGVRALYTDEDEVLFHAKRPVILNGIEELAVRGDLLDRALILDLPSLPEGKRRTESDFNAALDCALPSLLGAVLNATSAALANEQSVKLERLPRMADFAQWVTAAEPALGWTQGTFMAAYTQNRRCANELPLETPVAEAIRKLELPWEGTATELLRALEPMVDENARRSRSWPQIGRTLANTLRRLAPNLRQAGIAIEFERESSRGRKRLIAITSTDRGELASESSA
jgi:hypothetical protein